MLAEILKSLSLGEWLTLSEINIWCLLYCPWRKFFILLMLYLGGLILFPFTVWVEGSPVRTDIGRSLIVILVFLIKLVGLFCYPIGLAVVYVYLSGGGHWQSSRSLAVIGLAVVFLCAGGAIGYWQKLLDIPIAIWWTLFCSWNGVYYSLRKKNPESKWKWDLANVIAWILLMPCSIIGYMIYRGVF